MAKKKTVYEKADTWTRRYIDAALKSTDNRERLASFLRGAYLNGYWAGKRNEARRLKPEAPNA